MHCLNLTQPVIDVLNEELLAAEVELTAALYGIKEIQDGVTYSHITDVLMLDNDIESTQEGKSKLLSSVNYFRFNLDSLLSEDELKEIDPDLQLLGFFHSHPHGEDDLDFSDEDLKYFTTSKNRYEFMDRIQLLGQNGTPIQEAHECIHIKGLGVKNIDYIISYLNGVIYDQPNDED